MDRLRSISVGGNSLELPCFFPSISSIKTNLDTVEYLRLIIALKHPLFLISAYDIFHGSFKERKEIASMLQVASASGQTILLDSGNYESFWNNDTKWNESKFESILKSVEYNLSFCFDNQNPPDSVKDSVNQVEDSVLKAQAVSTKGTILPIVHAKTTRLPATVAAAVKKLHPVLIAVPERLLGSGLLERASTIFKIRRALDNLELYYPIHILGTGNPISILIYFLAGADSFDGLEWCQTTVDHETALLYHFQQRELFSYQMNLAKSKELPYAHKTLAHNLLFYRKWMSEIQESLMSNGATDLIKKFASESFLEKLSEVISTNS